MFVIILSQNTSIYQYISWVYKSLDQFQNLEGRDIPLVIVTPSTITITL
jgi:hypothetical protein